MFINLSCLCLANTDVWLTATPNSNPWPGTPANPYYAGDAAQFTSILTTCNQNYTFHYTPGTYQTLGWKLGERQTANSGCIHLGAGIDQTVIQLVGARNRSLDGNIFSHDSTKLANGFQAHHMTLDCNAANNPQFTSGLGRCEAVVVAGNNITLDGLKVIGFGTSVAGAECSPLIVAMWSPLKSAHPSGTTFSNILIENCIVTSPVASGNLCNVTCCAIGADPIFSLQNAVISNCAILNVQSDFPFTQGLSAPVVENCTVNGCSTGVYYENATAPCIVRNNSFANVVRGVHAVEDPDYRLPSLLVDGNLFNMTCSHDAWAINGYGVGNGNFGSVVVTNNTILFPDCSDPSCGGVGFNNTDSLTVENNEITFGSAPDNGRRLGVNASTVGLKHFFGNYDGSTQLMVYDYDTGTLWTQFEASFSIPLGPLKNHPRSEK